MYATCYHTCFNFLHLYAQKSILDIMGGQNEGKVTKSHYVQITEKDVPLSYENDSIRRMLEGFGVKLTSHIKYGCCRKRQKQAYRLQNAKIVTDLTWQKKLQNLCQDLRQQGCLNVESFTKDNQSRTFLLKSKNLFNNAQNMPLEEYY